MVLLDTTAPDEQRAKILADAEAMITSGGDVVSKHDWGPRTMAYEIRHKTDAEYHLLQFHGTPELLESLHRTLRITDGVVRFRIIKLEPGTPDPPPTPRARAGRAAPRRPPRPSAAPARRAERRPARARAAAAVRSRCQDSRASRRLSQQKRGGSGVLAGAVGTPV